MNNPLNNVLFDNVGNIVSVGDIVVSIVNDNGYIVLSLREVSLISEKELKYKEKSCIKLCRTKKEVDFMFRVISKFNEDFNSNVVALLDSISQELSSEDPDIEKIVNEINRVVDMPDNNQ